jgi:inner membrane protein
VGINPSSTGVSFVSKEIYYLFLVGYFSHVVLDMWNKNGVPFLWPMREYVFVIPGRKFWRIEVGSRGETIALVLFFVASLCLYQIQGLGFYRMIHLLTKDIGYAQEDFIKYSSTNFTTLKSSFNKAY